MRPALAVLLLGACRGQAEVADTTNGGGGDADTDADTDADVDADTDADTDVGDSDTAATVPTVTGTATQCTFAIPADAVVVDHDLVESAPGVYWVCKNRTLSFSGTGATIVVAENGSLVLSGTGDTVYAQSGSDLAVTNSGNVFYLDPGADLVDDGGTDKYRCDPLVVDATAAPDHGC